MIDTRSALKARSTRGRHSKLRLNPAAFSQHVAFHLCRHLFFVVEHDALGHNFATVDGNEPG